MGEVERSWWHPGRHKDRQVWLHARHDIQQTIRRWFLDDGFLEVDPGILQVSPGNETHLHAFETELIYPDLNRRRLYLHTSPEFACKKLLAGGERRIFSFSKVFRNREAGALHLPEFTMLEWYRLGESYERVMADSVSIARLAAATVDAESFSWNGRACRPATPVLATTVSEAFAARGYDLRATLSAAGGDVDRLMEQARGIDPGLERFDDWSALFNAVLVEIERGLGENCLTLLREYPAIESALARPCLEDPIFAERFELFAAGVELANGFGELTGSAAQRARLEAQMDARETIYGERYPIDDDFIEALDVMGPASGCALGFDRLVMLACGASRVRDVVWTPLDQP